MATVLLPATLIAQRQDSLAVAPLPVAPLPVAPLPAATPSVQAATESSVLRRVPGMAIGAVAAAAITQALGAPKQWHRTWDGYARRLGDQAGFIAIEETVRLSLGATVNWVPDTQPCAGRAGKAKWRALMPRIGCAVRETAFLRTPEGRGRPNFPLFVGVVSASSASTIWRPDADTPAHAMSLAITRTAVAMTATVVSHLIADWRKDSR
jgi:hypothetical protein